jgi:hypothetical protein
MREMKNEITDKQMAKLRSQLLVELKKIGQEDKLDEVVDYFVKNLKPMSSEEFDRILHEAERLTGAITTAKELRCKWK